MLDAVNALLKEYLLPFVLAVVGEESFIGMWLSSQPLLLFVLLAIPFIALWSMALFVDFIKDSWKMLFGIVIDVAAIFLFASSPELLLVLAFVSSILVYFLAVGDIQRKVYAGICFIRILVLAPFIPIPIVLKMIILLVPLCTIETFLLCITD